MRVKIIGSNHAELEIGDTTILYSYSTPVAAHYEGNWYRVNRFYSMTTSRHINKWLGGEATKVPPEWFDKLLVGEVVRVDE